MNQAGGFDCLVLPGGLGGAKIFQADAAVQGMLTEYSKDESKTVGIICAAPIALLPMKLFAGIYSPAHLKGKTLTCFPGVKDQFKRDYKHVGDRVVRDGGLITSQGPGTAMEFAMELVKALLGEDEMYKIETSLLIPLLR
jgi:putative intracellular protease/amidase